jgi:WXG100 family type VII secretion target
MAKAIVDPDELRQFAQALRKFNQKLAADLTAMQGRLQQLGETWRDQEQVRFQQEFEETTRQLQRFVQASEKHIPFLMRKAERIDEYLQQR